MVSVMTQCRSMDGNQEKWWAVWLEEQLAFVAPVWSLPYFPQVLFESRSEMSRAWCYL